MTWWGFGIQWHQLEDMQSSPRCRQITTLTPHHSIFTGRMLFLKPNQQCESTEGKLRRKHLRRNQTVIHLPTTPENVATLTYEMQSFLIWLKACCVLSDVGGSGVVCRYRFLWQEPVVICGNWNVRQSTSQQLFRVTTFCINACFQSFSTLISRTVHHAVLKFSPCRNTPMT